MENLIILTSIAIIGGIIYLSLKIKNIESGENDNQLMLNYMEALRKDIKESTSNDRRETQNSLSKINERLSQGLENSSKTIQKQFIQSSTMIKDITKELSKVKETNKQVLDFSKQLQSLENILKNPKQRGILGEYFLENLLANVLQPNQYKMQYKFKNGDTVDAAIFFKDKIIPIDSKFSLEKYNKIMEEPNSKIREKLEKEFKIDIKKRIDESSKYIKPDQNTTEFAFMFIPAEGVYYNLLTYKVGTLNINANDLIEYAFKKKVIIVSPSSFYAYLETVLQGLKALKMEESVKEIIKKVGDLGRHLNSYEEYFGKIGSHLTTTMNMYNNAQGEFKKIDKDILYIENQSQAKLNE